MDYTIKMVEAAQEDCKDNPKLFERLLEDAERPLYPGCKNFTKLSLISISQVVQSKSKIWVV